MYVLSDIIPSDSPAAVATSQVFLAALLAYSENDHDDNHNDKDTLVALWQGLIQALETAESPHWIRRTKARLAKHEWNTASGKSTLINHTQNQPSLVGVALAQALGSDTVEWTTDVLLPRTLQAWPTLSAFTPVHGVVTISSNEWTQSISPALMPKVKSLPDKAWPLLEGWMALLDTKVDPFATDPEWWDLLAKALVHANKEDWRGVAQRILVQWAQNARDSTWVDRLVTPTPPTLAHLRTHVYQTIAQMSHRTNNTEKVPVSALLLPALLPWWNKETKPDGKRACLQAAFAWTTEESVHEAALAPWWTALTAKPTDAGLLLQETPEYAWQLLAAQNGVKKAWQDLVESAQTKRAVQHEGLLALHASVLCAGDKLPAWASKLLSAGSTKVADLDTSKRNTSTPFFFSPATWESTVADHPSAAAALAHALVLYTEKSADTSLWQTSTVATHALVYTILFPGDRYSSIADAVGRLTTRACLIPATLSVVNNIELVLDDNRRQINATRQARESETPTTIQTLRIPTYALLRHVVKTIGGLMTTPTRCAQSLILLHMGTFPQCQGPQRSTLVHSTERILDHVAGDDAYDSTAWCAEVCREVLQHVTSLAEKEMGTLLVPTSFVVHNSASSLLTTFGKIASQFSPDTDDPTDSDLKAAVLARNCCTEYFAPHLDRQLTKALNDVLAFSVRDVNIYLSSMGALELEETSSGSENKGVTKKHLTEDEEWEIQIKKELAEKKAKQSSNDTSWSLSAEERNKVAEQDVLRVKMQSVVEQHYVRLLQGISAMTLSDIEVGNACLPAFARSVLKVSVSQCPLLERLPELARCAYRLLTDLASCVYEIDETLAPTIAQALQISCRQTSDSSPTAGDTLDTNIVCQPLPSPCEAAARLIQEMDDFHDVFSGASFFFLFPVIEASLMGPRTTPGCEASVRILDLHTQLLAGDEADVHVQRLRRDMILSLLELLRHDRFQTFQNPSAVEALVDCYNDDDEEPTKISSADLAPLLDQNGALGPKACRIGAMHALKRIAVERVKIVKNDPLVENRIWLCCFDHDEDIRSAARDAWRSIKGAGDGTDDLLPAPSPVYAAPLTPLLHSSDLSTALAAADAFAHAMSYHPKSVGRNIENLCKLYIESYPEAGSGPVTASLLPSSNKASSSPAPKSIKKPISTGLPKKKSTGKKSALAIAGIGKPKTTTKKKSSSAAAAALLKPKQERTLDQTELVNQFSSAGANPTGDKDTPAKVSVRVGVLRAIAALAGVDANVLLDQGALKQLTGFLIAYGLAELDEKVKSLARDTLRDVVANKGGSDEAITFLLPQLETVLKSGSVDEASLGSLPLDKMYRDVSSSDRRKEGAVVALGSVALHLKGPENESKIDSTVDMLLLALKTPSEDVQTSVADALTKLMKKGNTPARFETIIADLLRDCLHGDSLATRRGAAYGLSAAVKGGGIATLKKYDIVKKLEETCDTGSPSSKEGSLFAMELLSKRLGLLFEPYVIVLLPSLLKSFSDSSDYVRRAASNTSSVIMSKLSAHGVKLVMPAVIESFGESAWRTKQASIQMLGAMSHLAPKQLASALPKVVPKLTEAFSDTHPKVKSSAQEALHEISTVIRNPEIKEASPMLLKALTDPADETQNALEGLIATEFLHAIDAPSLALIVPIVHRGLRDRGATVKRMAGLIAGNICTMISDPRDFLPYLPTLLPDLQSALLDPIPDVRNTAAKALGTLARSLGDHILPELRPWLVQKLREKTCSSAERSGAAQGLTEVLIASGTEVVDEVLRNELLPLSDSMEAGTREGVLWMITFLPPAMGQNFSPYIDACLGPLVKGLSDDNEIVRDVAMRAGRVLIRSHGKVHLDKILPSLEKGLEDEDHRIRLASLSLLGDLLSTIGGTSVLRGDGDTQDDIRKAERAQAQIALVLGPDTRRRVLSKLYMARSDSTHAVRHSAIQIWKTVVSVTARALRDILAVLVNLIVISLASGDDERTIVAGQCLGDVVSKLGESVLPQIIPVLRKSLYDGDQQTKRGVCVGLTDVIKSSTKEQIIRFLEIITKLVQDALSDDDEQVRGMASSCFQELYTLVGPRAFDEIVPSLMVSLANEDNETVQRHALNGLIGILTVRSRELLPYIIPRLISRPVSSNHARALGRISTVTGSTIQSHLSSIIPCLLSELADSKDEDERIESIRECSRVICGSVATSGVNTLVSEIATKCNSDKPSIRRESCALFQSVVTERK